MPILHLVDPVRQALRRRRIRGASVPRHEAVRAAPPAAWRDPLFVLPLLALVVLGCWCAAPLASAGSVNKDFAINLTVSPAITVAPAPGVARGDTSLQLPTLLQPGVPSDATSAGWHLSSNWPAGYSVTLRATSAPALRGVNAPGGGAAASFNDFTVGGCPCPWDSSASSGGVFGYSAQVLGAGAVGGDQWGTSSARRYRGLTTSAFTVFRAPGAGEYDLSLFFRSEIPAKGVQQPGAYRANVVLGVSPGT